MLSLFLRNLLFTILQPGIVAVLIPYMLIKNSKQTIDFNNLELYQYLGVFLFFCGVLITLYCIYDFARKGKGTLSPADKTKHLVISGFYKYSRNPMYVGVLLLLVGEVIIFISLQLLVYSIIAFIGFNIFVIYVEEPRLKKDFEQEYKVYLNTVKRWI